jgi:hypothetical protein
MVEQLCAGQRFSAQESATDISMAVKPDSIYAELHEPVTEMFDDRTWNEVWGVSIVAQRIISTVRTTSFHALTGLVRSSTSSTHSLENSAASGVQSTRARPQRGIHELVATLPKFPPDTDVEIYVGKCCDVQPIHRVHFQPADADNPALLVLVDETQRICIPGRRNCSLLFGSRAT